MTVPDSWYLDPRHAPMFEPGDPGTIHVDPGHGIAVTDPGGRIGSFADDGVTLIAAMPIDLTLTPALARQLADVLATWAGGTAAADRLKLTDYSDAGDGTTVAVGVPAIITHLDEVVRHELSTWSGLVDSLDHAITHLRAGEWLSADHLLQLIELGLDDGDPT